MLLHTAERPKRVFYASAHCRKAKKKFFTLLHTAERPKRDFSCFCTLQKDQKEFFMLLHTAEKLKKKISAHGESHFPSGLAFPRMAKVISQVVWHFRARRKSFPEWFGISAHGESHFPKGLAFPRTAESISRRVWRVRESFIYTKEKIDKVGKGRLWHLTQKPTIKLSSLEKCTKAHS